jgi:hypothetical protein
MNCKGKSEREAFIFMLGKNGPEVPIRKESGWVPEPFSMC